MTPQRNVLGTALQPCSLDPLTGFLRDGCCSGHPGDRGLHVVCARVTDAFLAFSRQRGNDLSTPRPEYAFPGLRGGDQWCLCAGRWREALEAGVAPPVVLEATHLNALGVVTLDALRAHAVRHGDTDSLGGAPTDRDTDTDTNTGDTPARSR